MPGFLTHYLAGQRLISNTSGEAKKIFNEHEKLFNLGCQGPDIFFYYFPGFMYKNTRGLGTTMHNSNLAMFIMDMANQCLASKNEAVFAYTYGFVMHYALDSAAHPYVYARTTTEGAREVKNSADHRLFETAIDIVMLKRQQGKKPNDLKQAHLIKAPKTSLQAAAHSMSSAIATVYNCPISVSQTYSAMKFMQLFTKCLQTKKGRRKKILRFCEKITIREPIFSVMMHDQETSLDVLNLDKQEYTAPWEGAKTENYSFVEYFDRSVKEATEICKVLHGFVYGGADESELAKALGNKSLKTGF